MKNRLRSKLATASEMQGEEARRTGVYIGVHDDSNTASTQQFSEPVESRRRSCDLFRKEVLENKKNQWHGEVLIKPLPQQFALIVGFTGLTIIVGLFLLFAEFSEKFIVPGYLNSTKALVSVYPKNKGVILKRYFEQGSHVKQGDVLFLIDTSYAGFSGVQEEEMMTQLQKSQELVEQEIRYKQEQVLALKRLLEKNYVSRLEYQAKKAELIALLNKKNQIAIELTRYKQSLAYPIRSPIDGVISTVMYHEGQSIQDARPLIKIIPEQAELVAELFVPAKKAGFMARDSQVMIRYDAYPYERFGVYPAKILEISQSIMTDQEEEKPIQLGEPYYKVTAKLVKQSVKIYGKDKSIQHGMTLSAVIVGSKRTLWQWIFDPLYSYYGMLLR